MSKKTGWAIAVLGTVGASVVVGIVGTVVFRLGWSEPEGVEFAREVMESFDHDSQYAHDEEDPFQHIYMHSSGRVAAAGHRHCLVHDVNGDGDTSDPVDNDGICPGPNTGLPDLPWHPPLPDPGDPAKESALKWGMILGAFTPLWIVALSGGFIADRVVRTGRRRRTGDESGAPRTLDQPATGHSQDPQSLAVAPRRRALWANALLVVTIVSLAAGMAGLSVSDGRWSDSKNSGFAYEFLRSFSHGWFPHDENFWHFYLDDDGHIGSELHRHCQSDDVDGDNADPSVNDGTCPGPDTGLPDLAWHPLFPNPRNPSFTDALKEGASLAAATAIALTAIVAGVGIPYAARRNRKLMLKETAEATSPPTTSTD